ncbi:Casein kinase I isoform gamma-1 [Tritrichomonas foetus]|uniref:non-specific serine/threonine protein kinase n=1 Tax=Tritrichomonas foetus TaxID=1144522 RepID=A0A1J4KHJ6_9EUKA|nr:Casein kinase I isoform gamma-1 [Tritrichomonas foetus]|eukprot:OHT08805.1 Casein kinase I isoform gamma-1 [Tritrichomonas foetus]
MIFDPFQFLKIFLNREIYIDMSSRQSRKVLPPGKMIDRYKIIRLVGQGGYGDIYEAYDHKTQRNIAMKVELASSRKQALIREYDIMKHLKSPYFPELIAFNELEKYKYLCMELCGPSISTIRRAIPNHIFGMSTILRAGIEMLRAIEAIHELGFLHRDIKPSNFLLRPSRKYPIVLIDYGLSRPYINFETGELLPPRDHPGFVGTSKYASLNAHQGKELGRRDDLYSWFFSLLEMWLGHLPWSISTDKHKIYSVKSQTDISKLITKNEMSQPMPQPMLQVYRLIRRLNRDDKPNYSLLISFIVEAMKELDASWSDPYEWEQMDVSEFSAISLQPPSDEEPNIPTDLPEPVMPKMQYVAFARDDEFGFSRGRRDQRFYMGRYKKY